MARGRRRLGDLQVNKRPRSPSAGGRGAGVLVVARTTGSEPSCGNAALATPTSEGQREDGSKRRRKDVVMRTGGGGGARVGPRQEGLDEGSARAGTRAPPLPGQRNSSRSSGSSGRGSSGGSSQGTRNGDDGSNSGRSSRDGSRNTNNGSRSSGSVTGSVPTSSSSGSSTGLVPTEGVRFAGPDGLTSNERRRLKKNKRGRAGFYRD